MLKSFGRAALIASGMLLPSLALAVDCHTDCKEWAEYEYPCGITGGWHPRVKYCTGVNPVLQTACYTERKAKCESVLGGAQKKLARTLARTSSIQDAARVQGWTSLNCPIVGATLIESAGAFYSGAICSAIATPLTGAACAAAVATAGGGIAVATCIQLCADRKLSDCKGE